MAISQWPRAQRPRERLLTQGVDTLTDYELLAILIHRGTRQKTAIDLAQALLESEENLSNICQMTIEEWQTFKGLGETSYSMLQAGLEIYRRSLEEKIKINSVLPNSLVMHKFLRSKLRGFSDEVFACVFLDTQCRMIHFEVLFRGTIDKTFIHPRVVVRAALKHNARSVVFSHNHLSQNARPSQADRDLTDLLAKALLLIDVKVADHIIVTSNETLSFREHGLL